jgi:hypothetical protein
MDQLPSTRSLSFLESLRWAGRALRSEFLAFRFEYPIEIDPAAGPKESLHYYMYSDLLSWSLMKLDPAGIPRISDRFFEDVYHPPYIAWFGLVNLGHYLRHRDPRSLDVFLNQVNWLEHHAVVRDDGAAVWPGTFDWLEGTTLLKAPWVSAYCQGLVISALVRGWRITRRPYLLELLSKSTKVFEIGVSSGGIRDVVDGHIMYNEKPGYPPPGPLDGFLVALLALYDLYIETDDCVVGQLLNEGLEGLKYMLPRWSYGNKWSWYSTRAYLCPPAYHIQNCALLSALARLLKEPLLERYVETWDIARLSAVGRMEVFFMFLFTKNACRLKHRTWRRKRVYKPGIAS